jgi:hypothetical protein
MRLDAVRVVTVCVMASVQIGCGGGATRNTTAPVAEPTSGSAEVGAPGSEPPSQPPLPPGRSCEEFGTAECPSGCVIRLLADCETCEGGVPVCTTP